MNYQTKTIDMKILFDIKKGSGGRTYSYSLNVRSFVLIKGQKLPNEIRTLNGIPSGIIKSILTEYEKTGCLTDKNLSNMNFYLSRKKTSVELINKEVTTL